MTRPRRKSQPQLELKPVKPVKAVEDNWYNKTWVRVIAGMSLLGWILVQGPTALDNAHILPAKLGDTYQDVVDWYHTDGKWTAKWSNEGEVDARNQPGVYVNLDLLVYDDGASGNISSSNFPASFPLEFMLIEGTKTENVIRVRVYDYFQGIPKDVARLQIERTSDGETPTIRVKTLWQAMPLFPTEIDLWKVGESEMLSESPTP